MSNMNGKTWITSDTHFGHANILKFNPATRQFANVEEMNDVFIKEWNAKVAPGDKVFHLGDFAFMSPEAAANLAWQLNGHLYLIRGNHDNKLVGNPRFNKRFQFIADYHEMEFKEDDIKAKLVMFHFPIAEWNRCHHGSVHLHGHLHGSPSGLEDYRVVDVGVDSTVIDTTGPVVRPLSEIVRFALNGKIKKHGSGTD